MNILIVPDKFKGSLTAIQVCDALKSALYKINLSYNIVTVPLADGGEGTCELLTQISNGSQIYLEVFDPLMRKVETSYGISGKVAFISMAAASGLQWLKSEERNCKITSTFGTGQMIKHALDNGADEIIMGIGGSATNDAGMGMARALGYQLIGDNGDLEGIGAELLQLKKIEATRVHPRIKHTKFTVLCDVDNELYGINGAAYVFAAQKGAAPGDIEMLDKGLQNFSMVAKQMNCNVNFPGAGAAGGLGAGAKLFLNAHLQKGMDFVINFTDLEDKIKKADVIITGEGKLDQQTLSGKVVKGVADLSQKHDKKLIVICGQCELNDEQLKELGVFQTITLQDNNTSKADAISKAEELLREKAAEIKI